MNIWEFLDLAPDHRKEAKTSGLCKNHDDVNWDSKTSGLKLPCIVQEKMDGIHSIVVCYEGVFRIFSRTGKELSSTNQLINHIKVRYSGREDAVWLCEVCSDELELGRISGITNPNRVEQAEQWEIDSLYLAIFDCFTLPEFIKGETATAWPVRIGLAKHAIYNGFPAIVPAYFTAYNEEEISIFKKAILDKQGEGIVRKSFVAGWEAGKKWWACTKEVCSIELDLLCVGFEEGKGKLDGKVANLIFKWGDETIKASLGKGWTHAMAEQLFIDIHTGEYEPMGKIFRVYAMKYSTHGLLRQPKVAEERHDKTKPDK